MCCFTVASQTGESVSYTDQSASDALSVVHTTDADDTVLFFIDAAHHTVRRVQFCTALDVPLRTYKSGLCPKPYLVTATATATATASAAAALGATESGGGGVVVQGTPTRWNFDRFSGIAIDRFGAVPRAALYVSDSKLGVCHFDTTKGWCLPSAA